MRKRIGLAALLSAFLLLAVTTSEVRSDPDLTGLVNTTFLPRSESTTLHQVAHQRVVEIQSDFSHTGATTTEVIAWNTTSMERLVQQWVESPAHNAILSNPSYNLIGCAWDFDGSRYWGVCTLGTGTAPAPAPTPAPTPLPAPDPQPTQADTPTKEPLVTQADTPAGEPREALGTPNPVAVGSSPTAGASPALMPDTSTFCERKPDHWKCATPTPTPAPTPTPTPTPPPDGEPAFGSYPESGPIKLSNCSNVVIENLTFRDLGPDVIPIDIYNCDNVTIRNVDFINVKQGVYALDSTNITLVDSRYSNITGPAKPRMTATANFIQLNKVTGGLVARNKGRGGDTEDIVSVYQSSYVTVEDNHFEGTNWTSTSSTGIALSDGSGHHNIARRNILVNPGQAGIAMLGGQYNQITDNIIIGEARPGSNVGLFVWDYNKTRDCTGHTVSNNRVLWYREDGGLNPAWNAGDCGTINGWSTNTWSDHTLDIEDYRVEL